MPRGIISFDRQGAVDCPHTIKAEAGQQITWDVENDYDKPVTITFGPFKEKGNPGAPSPFTSDPGSAKAPGKKNNKPGRGASSADVKPAGLTGKHVYEYTVYYQFEGESKRHEDPEVIIEWPS